MRKKLLLLTAVAISLTSCTSSIKSSLTAVANKLHEIGEPEPKASKEEIEKLKKGNSIRKYLDALGYDKGVPLDDYTTVYDTRYLDSGEDATWNIILKLHSFCVAHGGDFYAGKGIEKVAFSSLPNYGEWIKYFGLKAHKNWACEGGDYNFKVKLVKGRGGFSSSVEGYVPEVYFYIHHPENTYMLYTPYGYDKKRVEEFKDKPVSYLAGWFRRYRSLGQDRWKGEFTVRKPFPMYRVQKMPYKIGFVWYMNEYCKANGGELYKDGESSSVWIDELIRKGGGWGWPIQNYYPLKGIYVCKGGQREFEGKIYPRGFDSTGQFFDYGGIIAKGIRFYGDTVSKTNKTTSKKSIPEAKAPVFENAVPTQQEQSGGSVNLPFLSMNLNERILGMQAIVKKQDIEKRKGAVIYKAYYNGLNENNCETASVLTNNAGAINIYNFKVCNGQFSNPYESKLLDSEAIPDSVRKAELEAAKKAKDYGAYTMYVDGYRLYARALRDKDMCTVEVRVLEDGFKLVGIHKINDCE